MHDRESGRQDTKPHVRGAEAGRQKTLRQWTDAAGVRKSRTSQKHQDNQTNYLGGTPLASQFSAMAAGNILD